MQERVLVIRDAQNDDDANVSQRVAYFQRATRGAHAICADEHTRLHGNALGLRLIANAVAAVQAVDALKVCRDDAGARGVASRLLLIPAQPPAPLDGAGLEPLQQHPAKDDTRHTKVATLTQRLLGECTKVAQHRAAGVEDPVAITDASSIYLPHLVFKAECRERRRI